MRPVCGWRLMCLSDTGVCALAVGAIIEDRHKERNHAPHIECSCSAHCYTSHTNHRQMSEAFLAAGAKVYVPVPDAE